MERKYHNRDKDYYNYFPSKRYNNHGKYSDRGYTSHHKRSYDKYDRHHKVLKLLK